MIRVTSETISNTKSNTKIKLTIPEFIQLGFLPTPKNINYSKNILRQSIIFGTHREDPFIVNFKFEPSLFKINNNRG